MIVTVVCLVLLFLPLEEDVFTSFPPYIRVSVNMKILAAYILGKYLVLHGYAAILPPWFCCWR